MLEAARLTGEQTGLQSLVRRFASILPLHHWNRLRKQLVELTRRDRIMSRVWVASVVAGLLVGPPWAVFVFGQKTPSSVDIGATAAGAALEVRELFVRTEAGGAVVEIALNTRAQPVVSTLDRPPRIVLDFRDAVTMVTRQVPVQDAWLHSVRIAQFQRTPPIARIVLEVSETLVPDLSWSANSVVIRRKARTVPITPPPPVTPPARAANAAKSFQVTFEKGLLTVVAENSLLGELISEIASQTGIHFEIARGITVREPAVSNPIYDRIQARLGPGEPHEVIQALLRPSAYRYSLVRSADGHETVVLVPKQDWIEP